ncbi:MAG: flavin-containing monooxygenase, partial [Ilumatobacteraceae bacterium]
MTTHVDVVIVGAGISGIGSAYHLQTMCPDRSYLIVEGRSDIGGTWDLFRYPGIRSDSDMHTLGFSFKPWTEAKAIADAPSIMKYLRETVSEYGIDRNIRFDTLVKKAEWSTETSTWTLTTQRADTGEYGDITCNFIHMCAGYYSYKEGFTPHFEGREKFQGTIVHPQEWPEDLDYSGKKVVVIGSGATAVTIVPAMADKAEHITMLQRSPTYVVSRPDHDPINDFLRKILPDRVAYSVVRKKNTLLGSFFYNRTRTQPDKIKAKILGGVRKGLGPDFDVDTHFTPTYNPWDQRLCLIPNGDLFAAINSGKASVVTDHIDTFTESGIRLQSGDEIAADIIVTATGLNLVTLGEVEIEVDGRTIDFADTWTYRGMAYSDVPNLVSTFGYINASWTLRADLVSIYVCKLLNHMRATLTDQATPRLRADDRTMTPRPWIEDFSAGYMQRVM